MSQSELFKVAEPVVGDVEKRLRDRGIETVIGVDEAGRGPLAGPVVAAAYWLSVDDLSAPALKGIDDSKRLNAARREECFDRLSEALSAFAIASSAATVIDELNVLNATFRAMEQAVTEVIDKTGGSPDLVLIDGNLTIPSAPWRQQAVVKGDQRSLAIAAASVLAKVSRDRVMCEAHEKWPQYGFASHKGYGTAQHREMLREYGPCPLHRRSFAGVVTADR